MSKTGTYVEGYTAAIESVVGELKRSIDAHDAAAAHCRTQGRFEDSVQEEAKARVVRKLLESIRAKVAV